MAPSAPGTVETDGMERQLSWALPELPPAASSTYTWGRSDLGQNGSGEDQNTTAPALLQALQGKDVVHAAGATYNSAFVTSTHLRSSCTRAPRHRPGLSSQHCTQVVKHAMFASAASTQQLCGWTLRNRKLAFEPLCCA